MTERTCENCRWWSENSILDNEGFCRRNPPTGDGSELPRVEPRDFCGEWSDKTITPEQEERRQFVRQIFLAMLASEWGANYSENDMWKIADKLAAAEPQIQREMQQ